MRLVQVRERGLYQSHLVIQNTALTYNDEDAEFPQHDRQLF